MNINQNTYNQPPQGPMMPPQMGPARPRGWRERWMWRFGMNAAVAPLAKGAMTIPNWLTGKSIVFFFVSMLVCFAVFGYPMEVRDALIAGLSIVLFFYGGMSMSKSWERRNTKTFVRNIFIAGFLIRMLWVLYCYFIFNPEYWGTTHGDSADV